MDQTGPPVEVEALTRAQRILKSDESPSQILKSEMSNWAAPEAPLEVDSGAIQVQLKISDFGSEMGFRPISNFSSTTEQQDWCDRPIPIRRALTAEQNCCPGRCIRKARRLEHTGG
jgi:hypothetical protein